ncbi:unnamed protein product [Onchocerca flexuosa]|uniref:Uncharacterized protein n=1 Tax=Onchocerca flexuosa TaxID=387005 RepID=A0A183H7I8_9BILA|nr:unnamed protein product [Onchocerca flexuosa]
MNGGEDFFVNQSKIWGKNIHAIDLDFGEDELLGDELSSAKGIEPTETSISFEVNSFILFLRTYLFWFISVGYQRTTLPVQNSPIVYLMKMHFFQETI